MYFAVSYTNAARPIGRGRARLHEQLIYVQHTPEQFEFRDDIAI